MKNYYTNKFLNLLVTFSIIFFMYNGLFKARSGRKTDFDPYYTASFCLKNNSNPYDKQVLLKQSRILKSYKNYNAINRCVYPPFYMQILKPLTFFNIINARRILVFIINTICLIIIFVYFNKIFKNTDLLKIIISIFFLYNPLYITIALGQVNLLLLTLIILSYYCYLNNHNKLFSIFLAIATLIKIIPAIIYLMLFFKKEFRKLFLSIITLLIIFIISYLFNPEAYKIYFTKILPVFSQGTAVTNIYNISINSFFYSINLKSNIFTYIFIGAIIISLIIICLKQKYNNNIFPLFITASLLIPKTVWEHHYLLIIFPIIILFNIIKKENIFSFLLYFSYAVLAIKFNIYDYRLSEFPLSILRFIKIYSVIIIYLILYINILKSSADVSLQQTM